MAPATTTDRPAGTPPVAGSARERLLAAANELFYREGVHTVGIDRIIEQAGVAKASLYKTFGSKDELVRAYLEARSSRSSNRIIAAVEKQTDPRERVLAVFDAAASWMAEPAFNGCAFAAATSETHSSTVDEITASYRSWIRATLAQLAAEAGVAEPDALARQLHLLYDGASQTARMDDDRSAALTARAAAVVLVDAAIAAS